MGVTTTDPAANEPDGAAPAPDDVRAVREAASRISSFAAKAGEGVIAVINHVGRKGARIVLIAADGSFGDVLAPSVAIAQQACDDRGIPVREWDRETTGLVAPSHSDRVRMGNRQR